MSKAIIRADDTLAEATLQLLRSRFGAEVRTGVHVSDLIFPRQAWFARKDPTKVLSDEECLYFTAGRAHHEIVESLIATEEMREVKIEWNGIQGTVDSMRASDLLPDDDGPEFAPLNPVEFKTTRAQTVYDASGVPGHYVLQLGMYCAMLNEKEIEGEGTLLILYLATKKAGVWGRKRLVPRLASYSIRYTDLGQIRDLMLSRKAMLEGPEPPPVDTCEPWLCRSCRFRPTHCAGRADGWG